MERGKNDVALPGGCTSLHDLPDTLEVSADQDKKRSKWGQKGHRIEKEVISQESREPQTLGKMAETPD